MSRTRAKPTTAFKPRRQRGIATVELAVSLPLLLLALTTMVEVGRVFYTYTTLTKAVETGSRYLAGITLIGTGRVQVTAQDIQDARNLIVFGNLTGNGDPVIIGLSPTAITVQCTYGTTNSYCTPDNGIAPITVAAVYWYSPVLGTLLNRLSGVDLFPLALNASTVMVPF